MDYRVIYIGTQTVYSILFLTLLYLRHTNERGRKPDKLDALHIMFVCTTVLDAIWMAIDGQAALRNWNIVLEVVYLTIMAFVGYIWFLYTLDLFPAKSLGIRKYRYVLALPAIIETIAIICSLWTGWVFIVDEGGFYIRGKLHIYTVLINYAYMLLGSYVALRCRKEALLAVDKRRFGAAAMFPIPVLLLSAAQMLLPPGLPGMQGGVFVSLLLVFGTSQNIIIMRDHLTGLPNRAAFEQEMDERIRRFQPGTSTHLYLAEGDLDKFKQINDTYGHPAGDRALVHAAKELSRFFAEYGIALFRTGGDEFMMIAESDEAIDFAEVARHLNEELAKVPTSDGIVLSMSVGAQEFDGRTDYRSFVESVDRELYAAK